MTKYRIVIHTADWHLGKNRKYADYLEQQRFMLEAILLIITQTIMDARNNSEIEIWFVLAGDVFDRNEDTTREELVLFLTSFLLPLISLERENPLKFKSFIIDGNHDRQPDERAPSLLQPFTSLTSCLVAGPQIQFLPNERLLLLPFNQYSDKDILGHLKKFANTEFVVAHECLARMVTDTGWTPPRDQDSYLEINNVLRPNPQIQGVWLGDIHKMQSLDDNGLCWYSGSPTTLDFGHVLPKGVLFHYYKKTSQDTWQKDREPELIPLNHPQIKIHYKLGKIETPNAIPKLVETFEKNYLQLMVSPEVYRVIDSQFPSFFHSPQVAWEFIQSLNTPNADKEVFNSENEKDLVTYYKPLIENWLAENSHNMTAQEKSTCLDHLVKDFSARE